MNASRELMLALVISIALMVAILSMPEVLEPFANYVLHRLGTVVPLAIVLIGVVHGLKPDEHTWPITVSYALMQRNIKGAILSTITFTGALTLVWTILSGLAGYAVGLGLTSGAYDPVVDIAVGTTMIGVALAYMHLEGRRSPHGQSSASADYRLIWIHGLAAAFGGDFFIVLAITLVIAPLNVLPTYLVGLLFGTGSLIGQLPVVLLVRRGSVKLVGEQTLARAGRLSLLILGVFLIMLGLVEAG